MIGEKARTSPSSLEIQQNLYQSKTRFIRTVSQGAALSLGILLSTLAVIYSGISFPKWLRRFPASWQKTAQRLKMGEGLATTLGLKNGQFKNFTPIAAIAFWVIPTFGGLLNAARDQYEVKELLLRFAAFNLAFFVFPITVEHTIEKWVKKARTIQWIGPKQNLAYLGKFISSLIFCSAVPTVLNIYLTRQRVKHDKAAATAHLKPKFFNLPK